MNEKPVILIVDDDEDFIIQQQMCMTRAGYEVVTAGGRKEAEKAAGNGHIDCAVIDLMMEETDGGFVLAYHLKKNNPDLPVIMVTSVTGDTGLQFGPVGEGEKKWVKADVVLSKPIRFEQLEREIRRLLA